MRRQEEDSPRRPNLRPAVNRWNHYSIEMGTFRQDAVEVLLGGALISQASGAIQHPFKGGKITCIRSLLLIAPLVMTPCTLATSIQGKQMLAQRRITETQVLIAPSLLSRRTRVKRVIGSSSTSFICPVAQDTKVLCRELLLCEES